MEDEGKEFLSFLPITLNKKYIEEGIDTLNYVKKISPTDPKIYYNLAIFYSLMFDEVKDKEAKLHFQKLSLQAIEETINLKLDYRDGFFLKAQLLKKIREKKMKLRKTLLFILKRN